MREIFVAELAKEVLGPRTGAREVMNLYPASEYIVGVLQPLPAPPDPNAMQTSESSIEAEAALLAEEPDLDVGDEESVRCEEDDIEEPEITAPPLLSPTLDPKSRPHSFGISFTIEENPSITECSVCLTWARYVAFIEEEKERYQREPHHAVLQISILQDTAVYLDADGNPVSSNEADISLHVYSLRRQHLGRSSRFVSLYVVNRRGASDRPEINDYVFQPEIRIVLPSGAVILPVESVSEDNDDKKLNLMYRTRSALARGHLASAVWKDVDPQVIPDDIRLDFPSVQEQPPFTWIDGKELGDELYNRFKEPDLRTEFVPIHSVPAPSFDWDAVYGPAPELSPGRLAGKWSPEDLNAALSPLTDGYDRWLQQVRAESAVLGASEEIVGRIIEECEQSLRRMNAGIQLLLANEHARLSFCFANKAIQVQQEWSGRELPWRPFQLAFVLMCLESITNPQSSDREVCDILWVATGGGKTEAYLGLVAFTIAYRRRNALTTGGSHPSCAGTAVITRYTLRLLTIQQFRRALKVITAAEMLRVQKILPTQAIGWRPEGCTRSDNFIWGVIPFSIGLWVGGNVTPNKMQDTGMYGEIKGAISLLQYPKSRGEGEPAQVTECPACNSILSVPSEGLQQGNHLLHVVVRSTEGNIPDVNFPASELSIEGTTVTNISIESTETPEYFIITVSLSVESQLKIDGVEEIWTRLVARVRTPLALQPASVSRPGYFLRYYINEHDRRSCFDFDIYCPNSACPLKTSWFGALPCGNIHAIRLQENVAPPVNDQLLQMPSPDVKPVHVQQAFQQGSPFLSSRIPINAYTADYQIYAHVPTVLIATVDKFARPPFEPRAGVFFGNVEHHHEIYGYYRSNLHTGHSGEEHPSPSGRGRRRHYQTVSCLRPPELILQDELHLIEGPLGSLTGVYEAAVDVLCAEQGGQKPKYIASSATIRKAEEQVAAIFARDARVFPPLGLTATDRFFVREKEEHPLKDASAGRLYVGICAPGRGPLTPLRNMWARLLQTAHEQRGHPEVDPFWTLTGYFNAVRELAGARALYRQDIPQRISEIAGENQRVLSDDGGVELSSRIPSTSLPYILDSLNAHGEAAPDALFTTSMFGTGIDIPRIGLMVVAGQPKTTAAYIQSTGRVGRRRGALVVTFYRASRPRDLSHYEYFIAYHRQLHRYVEPVTVYPFSPGSLERACGPTAVFILRNLISCRNVLEQDDQAVNMGVQRTILAEVQRIPDIMERRAMVQPLIRRPEPGIVSDYLKAQLDRWQAIARNHAGLRYVEYCFDGHPRDDVVLGDAAHKHAGKAVVFDNVPQSLRDIEETTSFGVGNG